MKLASLSFAALATMAFNATAQDAELAASIERGKPLYMMTCVACHQPTGNGLPPVFPPLSGSEYVTGDARRLVAIVTKGITGPLTVKGQAYNNIFIAVDQQFPVLKDPVKLADVLNYVRNNWENKVGTAITPAFVEEIRKEFVERTTPWTEKELLNFPAPAAK